MFQAGASSMRGVLTCRSCLSAEHAWHRCMQILQQAESAVSLAGAGSSSGGGGGGGQNPSQKRTEAKLVLQLATWMANTGQGAKSDITGCLLHTSPC